MEAPKTINDIINSASEYIHDEASINLIKKAYEIAKDNHDGQYRKSGDPYVQHPIEVAYLLTTLKTGPATICAGLLHDVLEDTEMTREDMIREVGEDITNLVDGVTKISKLKYMTKEKALAHNHQKILLAMAKDMRVILVKLVDRLHNMRTLEFHKPEKRAVIAKETLDLYAPLAHRLGMYRIKAELEDTSLRYINEEEYFDIKSAIESKKSERVNDIEIMIEKITTLLNNQNLHDFQIKGRVKNLYSIYKKIITKNKTIDEIYDLLALRIVVNSIEDCYRVLGLVHSVWTPLPMRFKDYIAVPKPNLYQSLHTTIVGNAGKIFEIQIRTHEMDQVAELGVAAHWAYKENKNYSPEKEQLEITEKLKWYKDLSTYVDGNKDVDPLNNIIEDIFQANVYVFTPNGDVLDLPSGSMPLDFAYRIHSNVGNTAVGAIVNGKIVPLNYKLKTGDVVSIKTNKSSAGPTTEWLKNCKTSHARTKIKAFINKKQHDQFVEKGLDLLEQAAKQVGFSVKSIDEKLIKEKITNHNIKTFDDLCYEVGKSSISPLTAINKLAGITDVRPTEEMLLNQYSEAPSTTVKRVAHNNYGIIVEGLDKAGIRLGNCCQPIKGDKIFGYVTKGTGIVVHREGCPNMTNAEMERLINVSWDDQNSIRHYQVTLKIYSLDKRNGVADMINALNSTKASILSVTSTKNSAGECITKFKLQVNNLDDLNHAIISLNKISEIYLIERVFK